MKKKLVFTLVLLAVVIISVNAQYNPESDFTVTRNSDGVSVTITGYVGTSQSVNIPPTYRGLSVTAIGGGAFAEKRLTSVIIPNSITSIGSMAFNQNRLTSVTIGSGVTTIRVSAFAGNQLTSITIPNSVITIENRVFADNRLTSITIPNSVTTIGDGVFDGNPNLAAINVSSSNINYSSIEGVLYNKNLTTLIRWPAGKQGAVVIPNSVTTIGGSAFSGNQLTSITIPNSVTTIGGSAFSRNQLTSITIPNSVTTIGDYAFSSNQLTSITIPNSVTTIGDGAFLGNQLTNIIIPNSVTTIGDYTFTGNPIRSVTIGSNVDIGTNFPNGFAEFYNSIGKKAGTYDDNGRTWAEW